MENTIGNTIIINGKRVYVGDAIERWREEGVCRYCIDYRLKLNAKFKDSYENFAFMHCEECICNL